MHVHRSAGVQLHPTSLPGGRLGREACAFVDRLVDAGQWYALEDDDKREAFRAALTTSP